MRLVLTDIVVTPATHTGIFHVHIKGKEVGRAVVSLKVSQQMNQAITSLEWSLFILESKHVLKAENLLRCVQDFIFYNPSWLSNATLEGTKNEQI